MKCPKCGQVVSETAQYCERCGTSFIKGHETGNEMHKVLHMLAYLGILFFLPLVVDPKSEAGAFHANQGLVLLIFSLAGQVVFKLMEITLWFLWPLTILLQSLYGLGMLILMIIGMVNAFKGEKKRLPVIGGTQIL